MTCDLQSHAICEFTSDLGKKKHDADVSESNSNSQMACDSQSHAICEFKSDFGNNN